MVYALWRAQESRIEQHTHVSLRSAMSTLTKAPNTWSIQRLTTGLSSPTRWVGKVLKQRFRRAGLKPHRLALDPGHLHVWSGGKGTETLVLLHGFGGSCIWQWADMVGELAKHYRLLVPDLLWFGESDGCHAERSLETQGHAIRMLLKEVGEPVHLAGISYGGFVSYLIANDYPDLVRSLTLIDCPATVMSTADYQQILKRFNIPNMNQLLVPDEPNTIPQLMALAYHRPPPLPRFAWRDAHHTLFSQHTDERIALLNNLIDYLDHPHSEKERQHPVLIIWGEHDLLFPLELAKKLQTHLGARAKLEVIPDTAHAPIVEAPKVINTLLIEFLARQKAIA